MANTRRESTASYRSEDIADSAGSTLIPALGSGPHLSTAIAAICQEATSVRLPIREPLISRVAVAVDTALALHTRPGSTGSTVSVIDGNMAGKNFYAVSIYPERTIELESPPSWRQLFAYALTNVDVLLKPGHALGTWVNKGRHVLDIVVCCPDRAVATVLGQCSSQFSIFNLLAGREIHIERPAHPFWPARAGGRNA